MKRKELEDKASVFKKRKVTYTVTLLAVVAIFVGASVVTGYDPTKGITSIFSAISWIVTHLVPNEKSLKNIPEILNRLLETTLVSVAVTVIAGIFAFFFSLLGSKTTRANAMVARAVRIIASFFRNVPDVVWAILLLFSFGQNVLTGFFALFFTTFGLLTRTFIETIDEVSAESVEALHAAGATYMQTVFQAIVPSSISEIITWVLFMIETNIRSSTLIGVLTGTGIGFLFDLYYKTMNWASASLVVIFVVILVIGLETLSGRIRKVIL